MNAASRSNLQPQQFGIGERFGVRPQRRDCPRCYRSGTLAGAFGGRDPIECGGALVVGCGALFWYEQEFGDNVEALVRTAPPSHVEPTAPPRQACPACGRGFYGWTERCDACRPRRGRDPRADALGMDHRRPR